MDKYLRTRAATLGHWPAALGRSPRSPNMKSAPLGRSPRSSVTESTVLSSEATGLHHAIRSEWNLGNVRAAVRAFVAQQGGDRACLDRAIDENGRTPLYLAAGLNRPDIVGMLLQEGASPSTAASAGAEGITPLALACFEGWENIVQQLLTAGAAVNLASRGKGRTAIHAACDRGHLAIVRALVVHGADIDIRDRERWTPIHMAAFRGNSLVVRALLAAGTSADMPFNSAGGSPLYFASQEGHFEAVEELLSAGAEVDILLSDGLAPLHIAAQKGHVMMIRALLAAGAEVDRKGGSPLRTALLAAADQNHEGAMQELLRAGASAAESLKMARDLSRHSCVHHLMAANRRYFDSMMDARQMRDGIFREEEGRDIVTEP